MRFLPLLALLAAFALAPTLAPSHARAQEASVAFPALPRMLGNPYANAGVFNLYGYAALFDGLTRITRDGTARPGIAESWEAGDGQRLWTFRLREGVRFSNGTALTSATVAFALDYLTGAGASEPAAPAFAHVVEASTPDPRTVIITLDRPDPVFDRLASILFLVEPELWAERGREGYAAEPIGTGPFVLETLSPAEARLVANPESWRAPALDALSLREIPDGVARAQALQSGAVQIALSLGFDEVPGLRGRGFTVDVAPSGSVLALPFITTGAGSPVQDVRVREALNLAINRDVIIEALFGGQVQAATQTAPRIAFGYNPGLEPPPYDPERARALLAEAGLDEGLELTAQLAIGTFAGDALLYQQVAADLARIGVTLNLQPIAVPQLIRNVMGGGWEGQMMSLNWGAEPTFDALRPLELHSCAHHAPWFCDAGIQGAYEAALAEGDPARRAALTREVMAQMRAAWPALFLVEVVRLIGLSPDLDGFEEAHGFIAYEQLTRR